MDADFVIALQLQEQYDRETSKSGEADCQSKSNKTVDGVSSKPLSIVDEIWELTDPNPDIRALFLQYNDQYFWGKLAGVEVRWSPRMTLCAGICCYEGRGGLCSIRLSKPLLQLRPRKDLVETLLHEMIHALLFVTQNNKDHDGHGPEFQKHMHRLNNQTGTSISIYHNFHDEVAHFKQHWWRCNGPCQKRRPYFGFVKRAMNRAPSPRDFWWPEHQRSCGGTYTKVKEPDGYGQKKKAKGGNKAENEGKTGPKTGSMDIRSFTGNGVLLNSTKASKSGSPSKAAATVTRSDIGNQPSLPSLEPPTSILQRSHTKVRSPTNIKSPTKVNGHTKVKSPTKVNGQTKVKSPTKVNGQTKVKSPTNVNGQTKVKSPTNVNGHTKVKSPTNVNGHTKVKSPKENTNGYTPPENIITQSDGINCKSKFSGSGQVLGSSNEGGKGLLAMLRKQWDREKRQSSDASSSDQKNKNETTCQSFENMTKNKNNVLKMKNGVKSDYINSQVKRPSKSEFNEKLKVPTARGGNRKRQSDEFPTNPFDFKKMKAMKTDEKLERYDHASETNHFTTIQPNISAPKNSEVIVVDNLDSGHCKPCPVCQTLVEMTHINEHLDRCLLV